jgi:hypothetical protein
MSDLSNDTKKHTTKSRETIPLVIKWILKVSKPIKEEKYVKTYIRPNNQSRMLDVVRLFQILF